MRKILITNDDGITADGIVRLAKAAKEFGEVWVVAPDGQRSAASHSITLRYEFEAWEVEFPVEGVHAYACSGTPADCVRIGVRNIVPGKPDNVLSGINYGYNMATDLQYSATAGAAFEAAFQKIHAIAFSEDFSDMHETADMYLRDTIAELIDKPLQPMQIWNVNFPGCKATECKGILRERTVSGDSFFDDTYTETKISETRTSYMVHGERFLNPKEGTDFHAVLNGYVSIGVVNNLK